MTALLHLGAPRPLSLLVVGLLVGCGSPENGGAETGPAGERADTPSPAAAGRRAPAPGTAWVIFGADTVTAEVARTPDERAEGLMYREEVPDGTGMLFVFEDQAVRSFWMENTTVALDIAFLDAAYRVVDIQQMEPESTDPHRSNAPAMFALEVRQGWFAERGIAVGDRAEIVFGG